VLRSDCTTLTGAVESAAGPLQLSSPGHCVCLTAAAGAAPAAQVAAVSNTPLVFQAVSSPMVSRSLLADPAERDALLALPYSRTGAGGSSKGGSRAVRPGGWVRLVPCLLDGLALVAAAFMTDSSRK
jgi:hypothetical protein